MRIRVITPLRDITRIAERLTLEISKDFPGKHFSAEIVIYSSEKQRIYHDLLPIKEIVQLLCRANVSRMIIEVSDTAHSDGYYKKPKKITFLKKDKQEEVADTRIIGLRTRFIAMKSKKEIAAVFAHELGHFVRDDIKRWGRGITVCYLLSIAVFLPVYLKLPLDGFWRESVAFGIISACIIILWRMLVLFFSRRLEYRADKMAVQWGYGKELAEHLERKARTSPTFISSLFHTHPPDKKRVRRIKRLMRKM